MSFGINNILMVITKKFHKTFDIFVEIDKNKETTFGNAFVLTGHALHITGPLKISARKPTSFQFV